MIHALARADRQPDVVRHRDGKARSFRRHDIGADAQRDEFVAAARIGRPRLRDAGLHVCRGDRGVGHGAAAGIHHPADEGGRFELSERGNGAREDTHQQQGSGLGHACDDTDEA
jgi:hypothetical protein